MGVRKGGGTPEGYFHQISSLYLQRFVRFLISFSDGGWGVELGLGGVDERWEWGRVEGHLKGTTIKFHLYIYNSLPVFEFHFLTGGEG